jgi:hypothetical protein
MSRARQLKKKMRKGAVPRPDIDGLSAESAAARGRAVRTLCPCRTGWDSYQDRLDDVGALCKDEDPVVRANALHVQEDAALMELLDSKRESAREAAEVRAARGLNKQVSVARRERAAVKRGAGF